MNSVLQAWVSGIHFPLVPVCQTLMLVFAHLLWQAAAIACALWVVLQWLKPVGPHPHVQRVTEWRYAATCVALFALPACVLATTWIVLPRSEMMAQLRQPRPTIGQELAVDVSTARAALDELELSRHSLPALVAEERDDSATSSEQESADLAELWSLYLTGIYGAGAALLLLRTVVGYSRATSFRGKIDRITDGKLVELFCQRCDELRVRAIPLLASCQRVAVPVVIGILRPVVLIPPALLTELSPDHMVLLLTHELAHIRRYDPLTAFTQRCVEAVLFFHPATWWISRVMTAEREHCCDSIAVQTSDQFNYADALLRMAELALLGRGRSVQLSQIAHLAADGKDVSLLASRVRRILGEPHTPRLRLHVAVLMLIATMIVGLCAAGAIVAQVDAPPDSQHADDRTDSGQLVWIAEGTVTDGEGQPLPDVEIWVHSGIGSLRGGKRGVTDARGKYRVEFGQGIWMHRDLSNLQFANVTAHKRGFAERNLNRHGAGVMANRDVSDEELKGFEADREQLALPGRSRQVDFAMVPAVRVEGQVVGTGEFPRRSPQSLRRRRDEPASPDLGSEQLDRAPLKGWKVWLTGDELPPASSVLDSATTDDQGRFVFENVPTGYQWHFETDTNLPDHKNPRSGAIQFGRNQGGHSLSIQLELKESQDLVHTQLLQTDLSRDDATETQGASGSVIRRFQFVGGASDVPLQGLKVVVGVSRPDPTAETGSSWTVIQQTRTTDERGQLELEIAPGEIPWIASVPAGYFMSPSDMLSVTVTNKSADDAPDASRHQELTVMRLWPGTELTGRLLWPDGTPAASVPLNVGVYINNTQWKEKLGMDLNFYSFDHGDWPNWQIRVVTDANGHFRTTVPPADARWWVRVGTTSLSFFAGNTFGQSVEINRRLAGCVPMEYQVGGMVRGSIPRIADAVEDGQQMLSLGDLRLETGVVVQGRVLDAEGRGLAGVHLTSTGPHGPHSGRSATSGDEGRFELAAMSPGWLTVHPDARLRDVQGNVISRDVQAVFTDASYQIPDGDSPHQITIQAVPQIELPFDWVDRRDDTSQPVAYYGAFTVRGFCLDSRGEPTVHWSGETERVERDGKSVLIVKVPRELRKAELVLPADRVVTASYADATGRTSGPGVVELGELGEFVQRTIFGDEPRAP
jgi:beta-lactamase regulating signal transducer with metallopeptidase domain